MPLLMGLRVLDSKFGCGVDALYGLNATGKIFSRNDVQLITRNDLRAHSAPASHFETSSVN